LAADCFRKGTELLKQSPPPGITEEELDKSLKTRQQQTQQLEKELNSRSDRFELSAVNQPANVRFALAKRQGLTKEALRVLEEEAKAEKLEPIAAIGLAQIYLELGQVEQAWSALEQIEEKVGIARMDPSTQGYFHQTRIKVAAARGDFVEACKEMDQLLADQERNASKEQLVGSTVSVVAAAYLYDLMHPNPFVKYQLIRLTGNALTTMAAYYEQLASGYALRGMLALELGDNENARKFFALAIQQQVPFEGRREVQRYLDLLQKELPKAAKP
jgi:tetratricopeptide (TPR) repeat protein